MKSLKYEDIFNPDSVNIFTDASIKKIGENTLGCPGVVVVMTDMNGNNFIVHKSTYVIDHSTNNDSEIRAIHNGIQVALGYRNFKNINLFSDSNICIQGLTNWIYNWINNIQYNTMYNSSGIPVSNQEVFLSIINTIVLNNLNINLYHQKGHVSINNQSSLDYARNSMMKTNKLDELDMNLVRELSIYNDIVDVITKERLDEFVLTYQYQNRKDNLFQISDINNIVNNIDKYKSLIGGN